MSGTTPPGSEPHDWDEVYKWELEEVYLLLDFIAGRPDKRLASLEAEVPEENPAEPGNVTVRKLGAAEIAARISALRFPPEGTKVKQSIEAAFLLIVKDRLCALAYPATAQSIAFTDLVAAKTVTPGRTWPFRWLRSGRTKPGHLQPRARVSVGLRAFPDLERVAQQFCSFQRAATGTAVLLAFIGALLLAEATYGRQLTARQKGPSGTPRRRRQRSTRPTPRSIRPPLKARPSWHGCIISVPLLRRVPAANPHRASRSSRHRIDPGPRRRPRSRIRPSVRICPATMIPSSSNSATPMPTQVQRSATPLRMWMRTPEAPSGTPSPCSCRSTRLIRNVTGTVAPAIAVRNRKPVLRCPAWSRLLQTTSCR